MTLDLYDTHCHLMWDEAEHPPALQIERARAAGVARMLCVAVDLPSARRCRELAVLHPELGASVGIHPNDLGGDAEALDPLLAEFTALSGEAGWCAIGETGLDFYRERSSGDLQRRSFRAHLRRARELGLPVIIHCRNAVDAVLEELAAHGGPVLGVMHCYSEGPAALPQLLDLGLHVSFSGNVTYPKAEAIRDSARLVPEDRLLVETDAPFLAPQAVRGKRNEPAYVRHTLERLAELRGVDPELLAARTSANARALFAAGPGGDSGP
ncbi:MAG TPA: TatD family hydrolase [Planctomycetota bacterium]